MPSRLQLFSLPSPPRPPAKLIAAFSPFGGSAVNCRLRKPSRRHARAYHRLRIHLRKPGSILDRRPDIFRARVARLLETPALVVSAPAHLAILLPAGSPISFPDDHNRVIPAPREPARLLRLHPRSQLHPHLPIVRSPMRQNHERMLSRRVRMHLERIDPVRKRLRRWNPKLPLHDANQLWLLRDYGRGRLLLCPQARNKSCRANQNRATREHIQKYSRSQPPGQAETVRPAPGDPHNNNPFCTVVVILQACCFAQRSACLCFCLCLPAPVVAHFCCHTERSEGTRRSSRHPSRSKLSTPTLHRPRDSRAARTPRYPLTMKCHPERSAT